ncbi:MAG TPA: flagellar hook-basal body protein [Solirubrobacteraceae bacterium]|nr:flagellar hook-basal body protein [Solirubrobacteraceae bacterium]
MDLGLFIASSGMVAEQARQDQLSNDLANASTPGFKPDESPKHSFKQVLLATSSGEAAAGSLESGVGLEGTYTDMAPGAIRQTGQPLDFAIAGEGFFAVQTAGGTRYTRDGQFTTSAQGVLTDANGDPVLDQSGAQVKVGSGGSVGASALGVFALSGAHKQGESLYAGSATGKASGTVQQGALEQSGVDSTQTMVDMISSLRTYQSGQQAIQTIGQTLQQAATQVGSIVPG